MSDSCMGNAEDTSLADVRIEEEHEANDQTEESSLADVRIEEEHEANDQTEESSLVDAQTEDRSAQDLQERTINRFDARYLEGNELEIPHIRAMLCDRNEEIKVPFTLHKELEDFDFSVLVETVLEEVLKETEKSTEGDYLRYQYDVINWSYEDGRLCMSVSYYDNQNQEAEVENEIEEMLNSLNLDDSVSDYEKVSRVYDEICSHILYDNEHLEDNTYRLKYSAYAAIHDQKALCNGYATLFYRILKELDIPVRCVTGIGTEDGEVIGHHIWNIVDLYGTYYVCDPTWDARDEEMSEEEYQDMVTDYGYDYFLIDPESFEEDHIPDGIWDLPETYEQYQISSDEFGAEFSDDSCDHILEDDPGIKKELCTDEGLSQGSHCKICGKTLYPQQVLEPSEHSMKTIEAKTGTCIQEGNTAGSYCENCDYVESEIIRTPLGRHQWKERIVQSPFIDESVIVETYCSVCNEVAERKEVKQGSTVVR